MKMAKYKDKNNVGASTANDILEIAGLQDEEDNGCCVRLTDSQADKVIQKLSERKISGEKYFNVDKTSDRSYGDLYVSRVRDNGYVWVLILYARRGSAESDVDKYADNLVKKGDRVAKSDVIALSASYEIPVNSYCAGLPLSCADGDFPPCAVYLSANCVISTDLETKVVCSYFRHELATVYAPCKIEMPTDDSVGYQRLHPDFKYAYLKELDYDRVSRCWGKGGRINLNANSCAEIEVLVEKIRSANSQLLATIYGHAAKR